MTNLTRAIDLLSSAANETKQPEAKRLIQEAEKLAIKAEDTSKNSKKELIAKVKFWFGADQPIFDLEKYQIEFDDTKTFAYIYEK